MAGSIPNVEEARILTDIVRNAISLRLYSNDVTPGETSTLATFTQVAGGGYAAKTLAVVSWVITQGNPSNAVYPQQTFVFTGVTTAPGTVYGYFLVDTVTGLYIGGERFAGALVPIEPVLNTQIKVIPTYNAS